MNLHFSHHKQIHFVRYKSKFYSFFPCLLLFHSYDLVFSFLSSHYNHFLFFFFSSLLFFPSLFLFLSPLNFSSFHATWFLIDNTYRKHIFIISAPVSVNNQSVYSKYVAHSISFQTFFEQAFKIIVVSWKFTMLLLYIVWDDWSIFMISRSNEQLQQQLEYTLLKGDCHSWWISKMQSGREDTFEERHAIKFCFKLGKNDAIDMYGMVLTAFWPSFMNRASVFEWHKRFKEGKQSVRDNERCRRSKEVNTPELIGQRVTVRFRVTMLGF